MVFRQRKHKNAPSALEGDSQLQASPDFYGKPLNSRPVRAKRWVRRLILVIALGLLVAGLFILYLIVSPNSATPKILQPKSTIDLNTSDDKDDSRNRIQIEKINLEVPFFEGGENVLDKGAWHRYPDRGNPEQGGNFILSAHRFNIGVTPEQTKTRSPFYNLDKLVIGDAVRIFYNQRWFEYEITRIYQVKPNAVEIEAPSKEAKITIYSCTLEGSADGRLVLEAKMAQ